MPAKRGCGADSKTRTHHVQDQPAAAVATDPDARSFSCPLGRLDTLSGVPCERTFRASTQRGSGEFTNLHACCRETALDSTYLSALLGLFLVFLDRPLLAFRKHVLGKLVAVVCVSERRLKRWCPDDRDLLACIDDFDRIHRFRILRPILALADEVIGRERYVQGFVTLRQQDADIVRRRIHSDRLLLRGFRVAIGRSVGLAVAL